MKEISVIIPCYNVEEYIDECVLSLVNQTFPIEKMELIFIDDASTDSTWNKLLEWESKYPESIMLYQQEINMKQGAARNAGLRLATGRYIGFTDSDDWTEPTMYEKMHQFMEKNKVDYVVCSRYERWPNGDTNILGPEKDGIMNLDDSLCPGLMRGAYAPGGLYQMLVDASWLKTLDVWFPENMVYEDNYFGGIITYNSKKVGMIREPLYNYRLRQGSTLQKKNDLRLLDRLDIELMKLKEYARRGLLEKYYENIEYEFLELYFANTLLGFKRLFDYIPNGIIKKMQNTTKQIFPDWRENPLLKTKPGLYEMCTLLDYNFISDDINELRKAISSVLNNKSN